MFANGSLLLTQVRPRSAGVYRCIGQGLRGPPVVLEATLHLAGGFQGPGVLRWGPPSTLLVHRELGLFAHEQLGAEGG